MALLKRVIRTPRPAGAARFLLETRCPPALLGASFITYLVLLGWGIASHEPWFDEAQAWLLARDLGFWDLQARHLRYEGTPGLWHGLLYAAIRSGSPYAGMGALGGAAAATAVFMLLRFSPFPAVLRCLLPFTFFLAYQYAVVARSYNLLAPLLFGAAIVYPRRHERPILFTALVVLLANVSLHGFLIALGIAGALTGKWLLAGARPRLKPRVIAAAALFAASLGWIVWQLRPAPDLVFASTFHFGWSRFAVAAGTLGHNALAESPLLSEAALAISLWWMWRRGTLSLFLVPAFLLVALAGFRYGNVWHEGAFWLLWIFALWVAFRNPERDPGGDPDPVRWQAASAAAVLAIAGVQIVWTVRSYDYDLVQPYSGSRELARALSSPPLWRGRVQIDGFRPVAALPYLRRNAFANLNGGGPESYWRWSSSNRLVREGRTAVWEGEPEWVILSNERGRTEIPPAYRLVARFPGALFWKTRIFEPDSFTLYRRQERDAAKSTGTAGASGGRP